MGGVVSSNPYAAAEPGGSSTRGCVFGVVGFILGLATGCLVIPVVVIAGLTLLGNSISNKFETIEHAVRCDEHPDDPKCRP